MKKQLAIAWLISLATFAAADPTLNSLERTRGAFEGQHILKWAESDATFEGKLEILDLTDNRVVFEKLYQDDFREDEFHSILDKLGIKSEASVLRRFPFQKDGDTYSVSVTSITLETDKENDEQKREYQIHLVSEKKGKKLVAKFQAEEFYGKAQVQSVVGFFQSPFENRIVILTEGFGGSLEGCTLIIHKVYGAHLGSGFKKL